MPHLMCATMIGVTITTKKLMLQLTMCAAAAPLAQDPKRVDLSSTQPRYALSSKRSREGFKIIAPANQICFSVKGE